MYRGERLNSISHLIGTGLSIAGLVVLLVASSTHDFAWKAVSFSIYGATLIFLYLASTLYHSFRGRAKAVFQRFDHVGIYLLIAGSYTPFALVTLRGPWGWTLFGINWGLALIGIVQELWIGKRTRVFSMLLYLVMGWLVAIAFKPLAAALPAGGLWWLALGGIIYTVGIVFYLIDTRWGPAHGVWHLFVLGGSGAQFWCLLRYVA
jgi:hemolysin III